MPTEQVINVYSIGDVSPEWIAEQQNKTFLYLEALIKAEQLNPETDWDNEIENKLIKKIAVSDTSELQRKELMSYFEDEHENEGDTYD